MMMMKFNYIFTSFQDCCVFTAYQPGFFPRGTDCTYRLVHGKVLSKCCLTAGHLTRSVGILTLVG